jgi:transcriptional regulator with XRE-family HTH domain
MSVMGCSGPTSGARCRVSIKMPSADRPLHRIATVRQRQGISCRTLARRLNMDVRQVKAQEQENADLLLSLLYKWQEALEVPVAELLVESNDPLSAPVLKRAQMVRLMKTATAILERAQQLSIQRMAQMLIEQLLEIMPELEGVTPWHTVGKRRTQDELGLAARRCVPMDWFQVVGD